MVLREQGGTSEKRPPNLRFDSTSGGGASLPADSRDTRYSSMPTPGGSSDWDGEYTGTTPSVKPKKKAPVKWHRWSYQRTDPNSWSSFKNVKPKQPPQETRRRRPDSLDPLAGKTRDMSQTSNHQAGQGGGGGGGSGMIRRQESILLQRANTGQQPSSSSIGTVGMGGNSNLSMDGTRGISVRLEKMLCETRGAFALENDSDVLKDIRQAFIELLVAAADPQADLSWTVSDPRAYKMLPLKIIECRDWNALRMLMCDLRFLWRSMVETGPTSILTNYQLAAVPMAAEGQPCERLRAYYEFLLEHIKILSSKPSSIFTLAINSRHACVRRDTKMLAQQIEKQIADWFDTYMSEVPTSANAIPVSSSSIFGRSGSNPGARDRILSSESVLSSPKLSLSRTASNSSNGNAAAERRVQQVSAFETMRYVNIKSKLNMLRECGLSTCLSEAAQRQLAMLIERMMQKCQSSRSRLLEKGLQFYGQENRAILGLETETSETGIEVQEHAELEQPKQFLDLAGLWDSSDKVEFVTLSIYIPPKTWNNEQLRDQYETNLCNQVAEAAHAPLELIDIVDIACPEKDSKRGMYGKCLIQCMELIKGLQVTVIQGKDFPGADQVSKSDPIVSLQMRTSRSRASGGDSRHAKVAQKLPRMALKAQQTVHQTASRPGELHPVNPLFNEIFSFLVYDLGQDLVITCYDAESGGKTPIGEIVLSISDVFSRCHAYDDETFEQSCQLCRPGTRKPVLLRSAVSDGGGARTPSLQLKFRFFTHQSPNEVSPKSMANDVMMQSKDPNSQLRLGCLVMGPAYHDEEGSWDTVRVYLSSSYAEHHAERRYLNRFVFPALAVDCLRQRLHFKWTDLSEYGAHGVKDDVVKRIDSIDQCRIRGYDSNGDNIETTFMVALMGEKRGRSLDAHDIRRLEKAESSMAPGISAKGKYNWALEASKDKAGLSVQELELRAGLLNNPAESVAVVCLRDTFVENEAFQNSVPNHVKKVFVESDISDRTAVGHMKRNVMRTADQSVVHYRPTFLGYKKPPATEEGDKGDKGDKGEKESKGGKGDKGDKGGEHGRHHMHADKAAEGVYLGNLEEFGLAVFEKLWRHIRQRFPSSRAKSHVNEYIIEHQQQVENIRSYIRLFHIVSGGTQAKTMTELMGIAEFVNPCPPTTFLVGAHGSGKSSILARLVYDLKVIPHLKTDVFEEPNEDAHEEGYRLKSEFTTKLRPAAMVAMMMRAQQKLVQDRKAGDISNMLELTATEEQQRAPVALNKTKKKVFNPLADPEDDYDFDGDGDGEGGEQDAAVELTEEEEALADGSVVTLLKKGMTRQDIIFMSRNPRVVFFVKCQHHTTHDVVSYLCSSLLRRQDLEPPSWKRLDHLVRCRIFERPMLVGDKTTPVLFILDGLSFEERNEVQAIVSGVKGRARAIMSISSSGDADQGAKMAREWSGSQVMLNGPLANQERTEILGKLFDRLGAKKKPANVDVITLRQSSESPLYLTVVASYISSLVSIYKKPAPLKDLEKDAVNLIACNFLPVVEQVVGEQQVRHFIEVVMQEPMGRAKKDVQGVLAKCGVAVTENTLRTLFDSFRPFSDPTNREHGGSLSLNRHFFKEAVRKRYSASKLPPAMEQQLKDMRIAADAQEARLNLAVDLHNKREKSFDEVSEDEDCQWLSDQDDDDDQSSGVASEEDNSENSIDVQFGTIKLEVNEKLFAKFSGASDVGISANSTSTLIRNSSDPGIIENVVDSRSATMDMNELIKMLRWVDILPNHVTKTEIAKAFRGANREHSVSGSGDSDVHELDFKEFLDCMARIQNMYMDRLNMMGHEHEKAALLIQRRARGNMARKEVRQKKKEIEAAEKGLPRAEDMTDDDIKSIVKLQSMARMKKEREKRQRQVMLQNAQEIKEKTKEKGMRPAVKGKKNRPGAVGIVQARLMALFDTVQDAFVYIDNDGNDSITKVEFARGLQRVGLVGADINKLSAMVAADGIIDVLEFIRLFAWHDVRQVDKSIAEAKIKRSIVVEKATDRLHEMKASDGQFMSVSLDSVPARTSSQNMKTMPVMTGGSGISRPRGGYASMEMKPAPRDSTKSPSKAVKSMVMTPLGSDSLGSQGSERESLVTMDADGVLEV